MAKSKNHTAHNQTYKAHRHFHKRPNNKSTPLKYLDVKFRKNMLYSRRKNKPVDAKKQIKK